MSNLPSSYPPPPPPPLPSPKIIIPQLPSSLSSLLPLPNLLSYPYYQQQQQPLQPFISFPPGHNLLNSLAQVAETAAATTTTTVAATTTSTIADYFYATVDHHVMQPNDWTDTLSNLHAFTNENSTAFSVLLDPVDFKTHAKLCILKQPGPVLVPMTNTSLDTFCIELLPHPLLPPKALTLWQPKCLKVALLIDDTEDLSNTKASQSKKRKRDNTTISTPPTVATSRIRRPVQKEYPFNNFRAELRDLVFPSTGGKSARLEFTCVVIDPLQRIVEFTALSNAFMIISNSNQWKDGLKVCLRHLVFFKDKYPFQAPFIRFFNYLQLVYLDSKGFYETRFLEAEEIRGWLLDSMRNNSHNIDRDLQLLEKHQTITLSLFELWYESAGPLFYDLHTANVNKLFQKLWANGFIGIGLSSYLSVATPSTTSSPTVVTPTAAVTASDTKTQGHCRLMINTTYCNDNNNDGKEESYLVLQFPYNNNKQHVLLSFERDYLAYFFQHSRNSLECTHLVSVITPDVFMSVEQILTNNFTSSPSSPSSKLATRK
jgi:hypothetical protein